MSTKLRTKNDSPLLVLLVGLFMIVLLQGIAIRSVVASPALGLALGAAETAFAWRMTATARTRVLRWLLAMFGVATILLAIYYAVVQPV